MESVSDGEELETLVATAASADEGAWQKLWEAIEPRLSRLVAQPRFLGRLGQREDDRRNIVVAVMARLRARDFHRLKLYLEAKRASSRLRFFGWLRVVAKRVGIDYLRAHPDYVRRHDSQASTPGRWVEACTLPAASRIFGERPPLTNRGTARELLSFAAASIPPQQLRALQLWTASESFDDIARTLALRTPQQAERLVRAALERLRRKYRAGDA
jgi:DNA-directed RNA polymerase specialized sigma24 family protein